MAEIERAVAALARPARPGAAALSHGDRERRSTSCRTIRAARGGRAALHAAIEFHAGSQGAARSAARARSSMRCATTCRASTGAPSTGSSRRGTASWCCKEFRTERNHQIVLAFDTGHLMQRAARAASRSSTTPSTPALLLGLCLRSRPATGSACSPSTREVARCSRAGAAACSLQPPAAADGASSTTRAVETNFTLGLAELDRPRCSRRSLVVVLTDFVDTVTRRADGRERRAAGRRHLVLFVDAAGTRSWMPHRPEPRMRFREVAGIGRRPSDMLREREVVLRAAAPARRALPRGAARARFGTDLINRYLDIKRRELI